MTTDAPATVVRQPSASHTPWPARLLVVLLAALTVLVGDPRPATAAPLVIPAAGAALPLSVVSAAVGGGVSAISAGAAMASAGITAAAVLAGNWAVETVFGWEADAPADLGDPPPSTGNYYGTTFTAAGNTMRIESTGTVDASGFPIDNWYRSPAPSGLYLIRKKSDGTTVPGAIRDDLGDSTNPLSFTHGDPTVTRFFIVNGNWSDSTTCATNCLAEVNAQAAPVAQPPPGGPGTTPLTVTPTTKCQDAGGVVQTVVGTLLKTTRSTADSAVLTFPACPAGSTVVERSAPITRDSDGALIADATDPSGGTSPWAPPVVPATYPDCAGRTCVMTLTRTTPAGDVLSCNAAPEACLSYAAVVAQWPATGTSAATIPRSDTQGNEYACKFGPYPVAVAECQVIPGVGLQPTQVEKDTRCDWELTRPWTWPWTALRCAFVPSPQGMTRWQTRVEVIKARPPANIVVAGVTVVHEGVDEVQCAAETPTGSCQGWTIPTFRVMPEAGTHEVDVLQAAGDRVQSLWGGRLYDLVKAGIVVGGALLIWQRISRSFGGKD